MDAINTKNENRIAREFFKDFNATTTVSKKLYPQSFEFNTSSFEFNSKKGLKIHPKLKNVWVVSSNVSRWNKLGCIDKGLISIPKENFKGTKYPQEFDNGSRLNINLIINYLKDKKLRFSPKEQKILICLFQDKDIRQLILDWNEEDNKERYSKSLTETMIVFIRCLWLGDEDTMIFNVFGCNYKKYDFMVERLMKFLDKNKEFYNLGKKIERKYELAPLLIRRGFNSR